MNITDALNYVEKLVPGTVAHKIAAAEQLVEAHKAEFLRATSQLSALAAQSTQLESYLDTVKSRIEAAQAEVDKLTAVPPASPAAPAVPAAGTVVTRSN